MTCIPCFLIPFMPICHVQICLSEPAILKMCCTNNIPTPVFVAARVRSSSASFRTPSWWPSTNRWPMCTRMSAIRSDFSPNAAATSTQSGLTSSVTRPLPSFRRSANIRKSLRPPPRQNHPRGLRGFRQVGYASRLLRMALRCWRLWRSFRFTGSRIHSDHTYWNVIKCATSSNCQTEALAMTFAMWAQTSLHLPHEQRPAYVINEC